MPQAAPYPAMSHLSSILERDAAVTDPARSKCSFSNSVPFKKKNEKVIQQGLKVSISIISPLPFHVTAPKGNPALRRHYCMDLSQ